MQRSVLLLPLLLSLVFADTLNVYIIPHSHDDAGWILTVDEYFDRQVKSILDTVTETLYNNEELPFHQVEQIFFQKWWKQASAKQQQQFKTIYNRGQIEFLNGGWVMHDDAVTTYSAMIDQTTMGHHFINDLFGSSALPRIGWTVDPFGLSSVTAKINKLFKMDYHVISRISFEVKDKMKADGNLDFLWKFDPTHSGEKHQIFTHVWYGLYCPPPKMSWDRGTEKPVTDQDVDGWASLLINSVKSWQSSYKPGANHIMLPYGCDFLYQHAPYMYGNMTKIINYINKNPEKFNANVKYAKVSDYFKLVYPTDGNTTLKYNFNTIEGDFFPYADNINSFWTGYYASRVEVKNAARASERISREAETLFALARAYGTNITYNDNYENLYKLRYANGLVQHHDGISGTERVPVVANYLEYLQNGVASANIVASKALLALAAKSEIITTKYLLNSLLQNPNLRNLNNNDLVPIIVYNSLAWDRQSTIRAIINKPGATVTISTGEKVTSQVIPIGNADYELSFTTEKPVPALGYQVYFVTVHAHQTTPVKAKPINDKVISNAIYDLIYNAQGNLNSIKNKRDDIQINFERQVLLYDSYTGPGQASGAYIFRSTGPEAVPINITSVPQYYEGEAAHVVRQKINSYVYEEVRLYKSSDKDATSLYGEANVIEFNFQVGPLPGNKEAVVRFNTNIKNNREILTENNGLQIYRRAYRDWPNNSSQELYPTASNFYPLVYHASIADDQYELILVTNTSRGVASLKDGSIEVMVHRRCLVDDHRGVSDPMDDVEIVGVQLRLIIAKKQRKELSAIRANQAHRANYPLDPYVFANLDQKIAINFTRFFNTQFAPLSAPLPNNLHLLNFAQQNIVGKEHNLLRVVNLEQIDSTIQPQDFNNLFRDLKFNTHAETSLNGIEPEASSPDFKVVLEPLQIRTFVSTLSKK